MIIENTTFSKLSGNHRIVVTITDKDFKDMHLEIVYIRADDEEVACDIGFDYIFSLKESMIKLGQHDEDSASYVSVYTCDEFLRTDETGNGFVTL